MAADPFPMAPLGDVVEVFDSMRIPVKQADRKPGPYPYYGASGIVDYVDSYIFDGEYLLLAEDGENLRSQNTPIAFMATGKFWVNNHAHVLRGNANSVTRFLCYALQVAEIRNYLSGSTRPKLTQGDMKRIPVSCPSIAEQQAIACILGTLDDKIELNRRMNQTLEGIARALFKSWFVDFDPVRAKAEGQQLPGLAPHIAELFPDEFEESELGEIPKGWDVASVDSLADINQQSLGKTDSLDVIDYIEINKVSRGDISEIIRYERGTEPSRARRRLRHGDTVLSTVRPDRGAHFLCLNPPETLIASTGFAVVSPHDGSWAFLYSALTLPQVGETLAKLADGAAYPAVRSSVVGNLAVVTPEDQQLLHVFERISEPLYEKADRNRNQSRALAALRDTLLPKLISGELRVPDAERFVGEAL